MRDAVNHQFQFAFEHAHNLLVRMLVLRERGTFIDTHPRMRHVIAMNQTGTKPWKYFSNRQTIQPNQRHSATLPQPRHLCSRLPTLGIGLQLMRSIVAAIQCSSWYCSWIG